MQIFKLRNMNIKSPTEQIETKAAYYIIHYYNLGKICSSFRDKYTNKKDWSIIIILYKKKVNTFYNTIDSTKKMNITNNQ